MAGYLRRSCFVEIRDSSMAESLCKEYFSEYGYRVFKETDDHLVFTRGSLLSNFFTFNPLKWKTQVNVVLTEDSLNCDFLISTIGQVPTKSEEQSWEVFIDNLRRFITESSFDHRSKNKTQVRKAKKSGVYIIKEGLLTGVLTAIPLAIIGSFFGAEAIVPIGAAIAAGSAMVRRIQKG